jgi:hypothetical protein
MSSNGAPSYTCFALNRGKKDAEERLHSVALALQGVFKVPDAGIPQEWQVMLDRLGESPDPETDQT